MLQHNFPDVLARRQPRAARKILRLVDLCCMHSDELKAPEPLATAAALGKSMAARR